MNESKKSEGKLFQVWINPLQLIDVDEPWSRFSEKELKPEDLIKFLCTPGIECDEKGLIQRYREISQEKKRLFAAPAEERILEKLVWPLRHAKASYMVGNYLGTISLSGMVSEMVAMLFFEMSDLFLILRTVVGHKPRFIPLAMKLASSSVNIACRSLLVNSFLGSLEPSLGLKIFLSFS